MEEILPNVQHKAPLVQLNTVPSSYLWLPGNRARTPPGYHVLPAVVESDKITPERPVLQAEPPLCCSPFPSSAALLWPRSSAAPRAKPAPPGAGAAPRAARVTPRRAGPGQGCGAGTARQEAAAAPAAGPARAASPRPGPAGPAALPRPSPPPSPTLDHVAVDGGAELLSRRAVPVLPVDDPHLLEEGGLAALARAQQQDLDEALHVGLLAVEALVDLLGLALLLGLAAGPSVLLSLSPLACQRGTRI
uniref:Uncharacterized protein n=1 Tax=Taeniopygia guttata TaxID=59729 RepID=A0A674GH82_TAEGU